MGFGLVLWGQGKLVSESEEFTTLYQGRSSNFLEGANLTTWIEYSVASGELKGVELFVFDSVFYKRTSKTSLLFEIIFRFH